MEDILPIITKMKFYSKRSILLNLKLAIVTKISNSIEKLLVPSQLQSSLDYFLIDLLDVYCLED